MLILKNTNEKINFVIYIKILIFIIGAIFRCFYSKARFK